MSSNKLFIIAVFSEGKYTRKQTYRSIRKKIFVVSKNRLIVELRDQ